MVNDHREVLSEIERKRNEFHELSFPHMDSMYNVALRFTKNELDAEDLVQDVYVRAFRFFHKFNKGTNFKAWIFKILTNTYINQYRRALNRPYQVDLDKVKFMHFEEPEQKKMEPVTVGKFDKVDYDKIFDDEIKEALDQIPSEFRIVVLLADVESFSYKEIAEIINRPLGTVMSRLSRGRRYLQQYLKSYAIEGGFISKA